MRALARPALLFALLCVGGPAVATPLDEARRHFDRLEYDQALASVAEARQGDRSPRATAESWLLEGQIQVALDRDGDAREAFRRALRLVPTMGLPASTAPKVRRIFDAMAAEERDRRAQRSAMSLSLEPAPVPEVAERGLDVSARVERPYPGAIVRLHVEDAPVALSADLPMTLAGDRYRAHIPGTFVRASAVLTLRAEVVDEGAAVTASPPIEQPPALVRVPAYRAALRIESSLIGATLTIDGREVGRVPIAQPIAVEPGALQLRLSGAGGTVTQRIAVSAGEVRTISLAVGPGVSKLAIARTTLLVLGGALLLSGTVLGLEADHAARDIEKQVRFDPVTQLPATSYTSVSALDASGRAMSIASITTLVLGGAAAIVGATLFAVRKPRRSGR